MKIYADLKEFPTLDDYIGKDVWVLCDDTTHQHYDSFYVRVLSRNGDDAYDVNMIPESIVIWAINDDRDDDYINQRVLGGAITTKCVRDFEVTLPVHEVTSEELFKNIQQQHQAYLKKHRLFERLAGTDMWIHVKSILPRESYYTNVISVDGDDYYSYDICFPEYMFTDLKSANTRLLSDTLDRLIAVDNGEADTLYEKYPQSIYSTRLYEPYELATTEELLQYFEDKVGTASEDN